VDTAGGGESETSHAGIYLYLSTDQVRFYRGNAGPVPLEAVPPIVFSEVMRNVDLFVGVCSIGNDPSWIDGGAEGHYGYWNNYNFGELSAAAETRRDTLAQVLPKLRIASRCGIEDRYLVVKGDVRTYKIHLGSGNILMEPNDQYLCIVASRSASPAARDGKVFLPFEGDGTLAIILSKALMLANDRKITDPTIVNQIKQ
jgi:hypothetical protein